MHIFTYTNALRILYVLCIHICTSPKDKFLHIMSNIIKSQDMNKAYMYSCSCMHVYIVYAHNIGEIYLVGYGSLLHFCYRYF